MRYTTIPTEITWEQLAGSQSCFAPSKYPYFVANPTTNYLPLNQAGNFVNDRVMLARRAVYKYVEIGNLNTANGMVESTTYPGAEVPAESPQFVQGGDLLISTVRTYRRGVGMIIDQADNLVCSPAILIVRSAAPELSMEYLFAFLRSDLFIEQILAFQTRGVYPRLDDNAIQHILVPLPKQIDVLEYVNLLVQAALAKETEIRRKHALILTSIAQELADNQKPGAFKYEDPTIDEVLRTGRFDTSLYTEVFKRQNFSVLNYQHGHISLPDRGFLAVRGTSLEIKSLGTRMDSDVPLPGYYQLLIPANISDYGTQDRTTYIGTPTVLKTIQQGDIIFGGEGFGKGRCLVVCEKVTNIATNYHGIRIYKPGGTLTESIFIRCFLSYWRSLGMIDYIGVGGSGGHCAPSYFYLIETPKFPTAVQERIAALYHTPAMAYDVATLTPTSFADADATFTVDAGIIELDRAAKRLRAQLDKVLDAIARDVPVEINFGFLE